MNFCNLFQLFVYSLNMEPKKKRYAHGVGDFWAQTCPKQKILKDS